MTADDGDVTPEADILLQLVADACDARMKRSGVVRGLVTKGHLRSM
jgi:hypothetical protein